MIESLLSQGTHVAVAVAFDEHTVPLVRFGKELATRLGKKLALIHVAEAPLVPQPVRPFAIPAVVWDKFPDAVMSGRHEAKRKLQELRATLPETLDVKLIASEGRAADVLVKEAEHVGASFLLVGTSVDKQSFLPSGFSTALSLMAMAPLPVLIVDTERHLPDLSLPFRILLADDLSDQTEPAVACAATLADSMAKSWVHHVHVSAFSAPDLTTVLRNAAAAAHTTLSERESAEIVKAVHTEQREALEARFSDYREYVEAAGGRYTAEITAGDVGSELEQAVKTYLPDLLVFGRHHGWHKKPFFFGRMPFKAMMQFHRPVLVVPEKAEE